MVAPRAGAAQSEVATRLCQPLHDQSSSSACSSRDQQSLQWCSLDLGGRGITQGRCTFTGLTRHQSGPFQPTASQIFSLVGHALRLLN